MLLAWPEAVPEAHGLLKADGTMSKRSTSGIGGQGWGFKRLSGVCRNQRPSHFILEAEDGGLYKVMSDSWNLDAVNQDNDGVWGVEEIEYKWYACCKSVHSPLEAAMNIYKNNPGRRAEDINQILVEVNSSSIEIAGKMYDRNSVCVRPGKYSLRNCIRLDGKMWKSRGF